MPYVSLAVCLGEQLSLIYFLNWLPAQASLIRVFPLRSSSYAGHVRLGKLRRARFSQFAISNHSFEKLAAPTRSSKNEAWWKSCDTLPPSLKLRRTGRTFNWKGIQEKLPFFINKENGHRMSYDAFNHDLSNCPLATKPCKIL